jgi:hypothetical protein
MIRVLLVLLGTTVSLRCAGAADTRKPASEIPSAAERLVRTSPSLDAKRLFALGMIETGNDDSEVGAAGEVSRYQIHPAVWKAYSDTANYQDPEAAIAVARRHWAWLASYFLDRTGRRPSDFDMYVLWNTGPGYYSRKGFSPAELGGSVRDRAQRFVNLVNRKG